MKPILNIVQQNEKNNTNTLKNCQKVIQKRRNLKKYTNKL